jgi:hypothetical protein
MRFNLVRPCPHCPFRPDVAPFLHPARAEQIARDVVDREGTFACHETTDRPRGEWSHCAGALLLLDASTPGHAMLNVARFLGLYDDARLDRTAPHFPTRAAFVAHHAEAARAH